MSRKLDRWEAATLVEFIEDLGEAAARFDRYGLRTPGTASDLRLQAARTALTDYIMELFGTKEDGQ